MSKKNTSDRNGFVYSTDPNFRFEEESEEVIQTLPKAEQKLKIRLDTKHRSGKAVTLIEGFVGMEDDLEALGKTIKTFCGTGGSVKDGLIIIQGDNREKIMQWMTKNQYKMAKRV